MSVSTFTRSSGARAPRRTSTFATPPAPPAPPPAWRGTAAAGGASTKPAPDSPTGRLSCFAVASGMADGAMCSFRSSCRTSAKHPVTAAAAAMAGLIRWVRPPAPCRPSKFRLDVDAHRSCGFSWSGFIPRHMEHPGSRQSKPASSKIFTKPSRSACSFTTPDPGTIIACTPSATLCPAATAATARRSSMRELVHEPMNTLSTGTSVSATPAVSPMYWSARSIAARFVASFSSAGSGTLPVMGRTSSGLVPQVTVGAISRALISTSLSNTAPSSVRSCFQCSTAASHSFPVGAIGRSFRYSNVTSSGATRPARAPASMAMLQMDMRASMDISSMALPANSMV
mmetsp:Transcript_4277/g.11953  ORF Transcript_4277/g.11953 Transcript_4277/m.11953 type:complete len:342 (-) Transcript_4277:1730-2755(-)